MKTVMINETERGRVFLCSSCNSIHMEFGNISLRFPFKDFVEFRKTLDEIDIKNIKKEPFFIRNNNRVCFETGLPDVHLLFSIEEIKELKALLLKKGVLNVIVFLMIIRRAQNYMAYWIALKQSCKKN